MAVPKRRTSKRRLRSRRASSSHRKPESPTTTCPQCGATSQPHRACAACGYYRGRQVLVVEAD